MTVNHRFLYPFVFSLFLLVLVCFGSALGAVGVGQKATPFSLPDTQGHSLDLNKVKNTSMTVLYFFDAGSQASQEGLLMLDTMLSQYADKQLAIWGITRSSQADVLAFARKAQLRFPLLLDNGEVSKQYDARLILPVICILGPDLTVLDYFQGGGKSAEAMLVSLAQSQLHRDRPQLAEALGATVARKDPRNLEAQAVQGYAALEQGQADKAEKVFNHLAAKPGSGKIMAKEGQAAVLAFQGKTDKALALAQEVTHEAPKRGPAYKLKGDLLAAKGDTQAAANAYEQALKQPQSDIYLKAETHNQLGRLYAQKGQYAPARAQFDEAVDLDPYYLEATSNKGVTYEKQGQWSNALESYRKALTLDQSDTIAAVLAQKAEKMLALQENASDKQRIDRLVSDLVKRYRDQKMQPSTQPKDEWTSRPMVMTFVDMKESGGLASRDGLAIVLATRLGDLLSGSGRVQVVERAVIEKLLSELNLGSSELSDPGTALKLGKILAAKLIGTGSLIYLPDGTLLNVRLIDTETSAVVKTFTLQLPIRADLEREMFKLNRSILMTVMAKYPLRGYVVQVNGDQVMLNLGHDQGITSGSAFEVIDPGQSVTYKGKLLRGSAKRVGRLEIVQVEPDFCYARIIEKQRAFKADDKVKEILPEMAAEGSRHAN